MTISNDLLEILVCPEDRTKLRIAPAETIQQLNQAIAAGTVCNRAGDPVATPLDGGLIREDGQFLYPIVEDIPVLLIDEGIPSKHLPAATSP